jgi:hypothetical protein
VATWGTSTMQMPGMGQVQQMSQVHMPQHVAHADAPAGHAPEPQVRTLHVCCYVWMCPGHPGQQGMCVYPGWHLYA